MKVDIITPEPVDSEVVLTMSETEAAVLKKILGKTRGDSTTLTRMKNALLGVSGNKCKDIIQYNTTGYLVANELTGSQVDSEW